MTFGNANAWLQSTLENPKQQMILSSCFISVELRNTEMPRVSLRKLILGSSWCPGLKMAQTMLLAKAFPRRASVFPCVCSSSAGPWRANNDNTTEEEPRFRTRHSRHRPRDAHKDYYKVLGVRSNATVQDIKVAFRQFARKYHPDVNKDIGADKMFKTICIAYKVLSDKTSRNAHDDFLRGQAQAARKKTYKPYQAGYNRGRAVPYNFQWRRASYRRTVNDEDVWDFSLGDNGFMQSEVNECSSAFGSETAGRTYKDSAKFETRAKK